MKKVTLPFIFTLLIGLVFHTSGHSQSVPSFTGHAATDFLTTPGYIHFNDFVYDVGLPAAAPAGTVSGWDMQTAFFFYDPVSDRLYVGVDFAGIFGDADGDGNPSNTSSWLSSLLGTDNSDLGNTEGFVLAFDNGNDGNFDVYIGVSRIEEISEFGIYVYTSDEEESPEFFPVSSTGSVLLHTEKHNAQTPDLEFVVENISDYVDNVCGVDFTIFAGSYDDGPIGEDYMNGRLEICTLPIELVEFNSLKNGRRVQLNWTTATENNNAYFEIQHATDVDSNFKSIGTVNGSGTTLSPTSYTFFHDTPVKGNNYYRIKQVDLNGVEWLSWVVTIHHPGSGDGRTIDVFPNPNIGEFMIGLPDITAEVEALIHIIDTKGAVVSETMTTLNRNSMTHPIDVKGLPKGVYHVSLTLMTGHIYNKSFVIR